MAPYKEKEIEKLFYTIGEVATQFNVNTSLIRFWENEFDILKPKKNKKGNRLFSKEDVDNIRKIYTLVKEEKYTISGAKKVLKEQGKTNADDATDSLNKALLSLKSSLRSIQEQLS